MSQQPGGPVPPSMPYEGQYPPQYDPAAQAAQAPPEGVIPGSDTAAENVDEMVQRLADAKLRAVLSDYEKQMQDMFAAAQQQQNDFTSALKAQVTQLQGQLAAVRAQAGPPEALLLAKSAATRIASIAAANPDLPPGHFAGVTDQGTRLAAATEALANGDGQVSEVERLAHGIDSWFNRVHPRVSGKMLEGSHALMEELERLVEGAAELAPAAAAIAAAV